MVPIYVVGPAQVDKIEFESIMLSSVLEETGEDTPEVVTALKDPAPVARHVIPPEPGQLIYGEFQRFIMAPAFPVDVPVIHW